MGYSGVSGMLAAFITNPFDGALLGLESAQGGPGGRQTYFWVLFPSLLASAVSTVVFVFFSGVFFETLYQFPDYAPRLADLLFAVPLGLLGGVIGALFMLSLKRLQQPFLPIKKSVVLRGLLGGLGMGIIGAIWPITLFSGEAETAELIAVAVVVSALLTALLAMRAARRASADVEST
jgi:H+/Cl- antiporter ClcA